MLDSNKDFEGNLLATFQTVPRRAYREMSGKGDPAANDVTLGGCHFFSLQAVKALDNLSNRIKWHSYAHLSMKRPINRRSRASIRVSHLTQATPYQPGTINRSGAPCRSESGSPFSS